MDELSKLAVKYGADKWGKHHYTPVYYDLFADSRNMIKKVLEIGVGEGASLRMWRDFFPEAMIYGGDNEDNRIFTANRIEVIKCNQSKPETLTKLLYTVGQDVDLIVDDGSHNPKDQENTVFVLWPLLKKGGIYVIEDVADEKLFSRLSPSLSRMKVEEAYVKSLSSRYDDRLIIIKHK